MMFNAAFLPGSRLLAAALVAAALAGCATAPAVHTAARATPAAPDPGWQALLAGAAAQVRRCYRGPRVGHAGRQIVTRLRILVTPEGMIDGRPVVIAQEGLTPLNRLYADRMAQAAIQSVLRCAPLSVPPGFAREGSIEFDLTFSPLASA